MEDVQSEEELFDGLVAAEDKVAFLREAFRSGDEARKEEAVGYTALLMQEDGFLDR
jgi:hypothetical protein